MRAHEGDLVAVDSHHVGAPERHGEIVEVRDQGGSEHYRVRWESGEESILFPQSDVRLLDRHGPTAPAPISPPAGRGSPGMPDKLEIDLRPSLPTDQYHHSFEIWLAEDDHQTEARVTVQLREVEMTGFGVARRNPRDPQVPAVGEELAMSRALQDLAGQLRQLATFQLERREGRPVDLSP